MDDWLCDDNTKGQRVVFVAFSTIYWCLGGLSQTWKHWLCFQSLFDTRMPRKIMGSDRKCQTLLFLLFIQNSLNFIVSSCSWAHVWKSVGNDREENFWLALLGILSPTYPFSVPGCQLQSRTVKDIVVGGQLVINQIFTYIFKESSRCFRILRYQSKFVKESTIVEL